MNGFLGLFEQRIRGVRLIELVGVVLVFAMIFWVCLSKAREGEDIHHMAELNKQIETEQAAVTDLKITVAKLERPERLEAMAVAYLGMKPVAASHEASLDSIGDISRATSRPAAVAATGVTPPSVSASAAPTPAQAAPAAATAAPKDTLISTAKPVTAGGAR